MMMSKTPLPILLPRHLPALDLLLRQAAHLFVVAENAGDTSAANAFLRVIRFLSRGGRARVKLVEQGRVLLVPSSRPGKNGLVSLYGVQLDQACTCVCEATSVCWHQALGETVLAAATAPLRQVVSSGDECLHTHPWPQTKIVGKRAA